MYSIDFNKLVTQNCPSVLLKDKFLSVIFAFINPIKVLYNDLVTYQTEVAEKLSYNSQIIYLNKILNDKFKTLDIVNDIYVDDVANIEYVKILNKAEGLPYITIYNKAEDEDETTFKNKAEYNSIVDFNIMVPTAIYTLLTANSNALLNKMKATVNFYKLAGKRYNIVSY